MRRILILFGLLGLLVCAAPATTASAFDTTGGVDCSGPAKNSVICKERTSQNPVSGSDGLLVRITEIVSYIAGAAAIIIVIISGIRYASSGGDSAKVSSAKSTLVGAVIGLIVIVLARILIIYVVKKL